MFLQVRADIDMASVPPMETEPKEQAVASLRRGPRSRRLIVRGTVIEDNVSDEDEQDRTENVEEGGDMRSLSKAPQQCLENGMLCFGELIPRSI